MGALNTSQIANLWVKQGGNRKYARLMAQIAQRESGGRTKINNKGTNSNGTVDWGLFQVNDVWRKDPVIGKMFRSGEILTADGNTKAAIRILKVQGPKAWATYRAGVDNKFLGGFHGSAADAQASQPSTHTTTTPGTDNSGQRGALIAQFLNQKQPDVLDFAMGVRALQDVPGTSKTVTTPGTSTGSSAADSYTARANAIDRKHMPYLWGGGHGGKVDPYHASPLDCSGAVSAVLGIDPRVSGQFTSWGKPGQGDGKGIVVYANGHHVFMKIHGKFFGTSRANPGGGAGWFSAKNVSPGYLRGFTVRHM